MNRSEPRLPFIPPPDYTVKLPSPTKQPPASRHHLLTVFTDLHNNDHIVDLTAGKIVPTMGELKASEEPVDQSSPEERAARVKRMLHSQGVPVFPGLGARQRRPAEPVASSTGSGNEAHLGPTRAYLRHLENHRKYDTMRSFQSCDKCPICKQMLREIDLIARRHARTGELPQHQPQPQQPQPQPVFVAPEPPIQPPPRRRPPNDFLSGRIFDPLPEPIDEADEVILHSSTSSSPPPRPRMPSTSSGITTAATYPPEPGELEPSARSKADWTAEAIGQLSVAYGETLRVSKMGDNWVLCTNRHNQSGWVPTRQLYLMPTGSQ